METLKEHSQSFSRGVSGQLGHWVCLGLGWNVLRRLFFIRGLSELSGSLSDTTFPSQLPNSAAIVKVRRNVVSDLLLLPGSLCINPSFVPFLCYTTVPC